MATMGWHARNYYEQHRTHSIVSGEDTLRPARGTKGDCSFNNKPLAFSPGKLRKLSKPNLLFEFAGLSDLPSRKKRSRTSSKTVAAVEPTPLASRADKPPADTAQQSLSQAQLQAKADSPYSFLAQFEEPPVELLKDLETKPITVAQLTQEVKDIYAGLVMVEKKCIEIDDSDSLAGRSWRETAAALSAITPICAEQDTGGIDMYSLNHRNSYASNDLGTYTPVTTFAQTIDIDKNAQSSASSRPGYDHVEGQGRVSCRRKGCSGENVSFERACEWKKHMDKHQRSEGFAERGREETLASPNEPGPAKWQADEKTKTIPIPETTKSFGDTVIDGNGSLHQGDNLNSNNNYFVFNQGHWTSPQYLAQDMWSHIHQPYDYNITGYSTSPGYFGYQPMYMFGNMLNNVVNMVGITISNILSNTMSSIMPLLMTQIQCVQSWQHGPLKF